MSTRWKPWERLRPSAPTTRRTASAARSSPGLSEQRSLEMRSGSIGTTRSGKIDRMAAQERLAVERGAGPYVVGDVGDGDADDEAAGVVGIVIARGVYGVVVILGVGRVDGDEGQRAPILAAGKPRRLGGL